MKTQRLNLSDVQILVIGDRVWGRAKTLKEALKNAGKPRQYIAYLCTEGTALNSMGNITYPNEKQAPIEFHRVGIKEEKDKSAAAKEVAKKLHERFMKGGNYV
jgi:hypothetical protein